MELAVHERLILLSILPKQGTITTLRIVRELRHALEFDEAELMAFEIQEIPDGRVSFNTQKTHGLTKTVEITPKMTEIIAAEFKSLDDNGATVTEHHLALYERFSEMGTHA